MGMDTSTAILLSMILPAVAVVLNLVLRHRDNLRDGLTFVIAAATFAVVLVILYNVGSQTTAPLVLFEVLPGLDLAFNVEPLGLKSTTPGFLPVFLLRSSRRWALPLPPICSPCSCFTKH